MKFNAIWPFIEFAMTWFFAVLAKMMDQCKLIPNNPYRTRAKTILGFEALYSGPEFAIHWKYATILNVVFVTFFFGPALPILFPIATLTLFILSTMERL